MKNRHDDNIQLTRRSALAVLRNYLVKNTLKNEEFVLWIDSDLWRYDSNVISYLVKANKDIVVPNCVMDLSNRTYDMNSWRMSDSFKKYLNSIEDRNVLVTQGGIENNADHLDDIRNTIDCKDIDCMVELDAVGGTMLLVKSYVFKSGTYFPEKIYNHFIETEGFGVLAKDKGYKIYGFPNLYIYHR